MSENNGRPDDLSLIFYDKHWHKCSRVLIKLIIKECGERDPPIPVRWTSACGAANLLSYLICTAQYLKAEERDGWFYHTENQIYNDMWMTPRVQQELLGLLIQLGWLQRKKRDSTGKRWFLIQTEKIADRIWEIETNARDTSLP